MLKVRAKNIYDDPEIVCIYDIFTSIISCVYRVAAPDPGFLVGSVAKFSRQITSSFRIHPLKNGIFTEP